MPLKFRCSDAWSNCGFTASAESEREREREMRDRIDAQRDHGMDTPCDHQPRDEEQDSVQERYRAPRHHGDDDDYDGSEMRCSTVQCTRFAYFIPRVAVTVAWSQEHHRHRRHRRQQQ